MMSTRMRSNIAGMGKQGDGLGGGITQHLCGRGECIGELLSSFSCCLLATHLHLVWMAVAVQMSILVRNWWQRTRVRRAARWNRWLQGFAV